MAPLEQFFAFSFVSVFSVALLATWLRYSPNLNALNRTFLQNHQYKSAKS